MKKSNGIIRNKWTISDKEEVVKLHKDGYGNRLIGQKLGISVSLIKHWIQVYKHLGIGWLERPPAIRATFEIKKAVVQEVLENSLSLHQVSLRFGISATSAHGWVSTVRKKGYEGLLELKPRGRPPKVMKQFNVRLPKTELEQLQEENARLKAENALLKKVQVLVEEREARQHLIGQQPSKN